jgi:cell volume regulation protein A
VPLALSFEVVQVIPTLRGVPEVMGDTLAHNAQSIVFIVVIINLLVQARTLPPLCRWLNGQAEPAPLS